MGTNGMENERIVSSGAAIVVVAGRVQCVSLFWLLVVGMERVNVCQL